jgi:amino acid adenylation domain-containing protein
MNELWANLSKRGVELWTDGEQIHYRGPRQVLTPPVLAQIRERKQELLEELKSGTVVRTYPLSHPQRALWYIHQSAPDSSAYNTAMALRLRFDPDVKALTRALQGLLVRHPCLRTTFQPADGADGFEPAQRVHAYREVRLEQVDASAWSAEEPDELRERVREAHQRPFDLENGPAFRASLFTRGERDHVLLVSAHHIVCDGWSMWLLMDELWRDYVSLSPSGAETLPELVPSLIEALRPILEADLSEPAAAGSAGAGELERFVREALAAVFQGMGGWGSGELPKETLRARSNVLPKYARLFDALIDLLPAQDGAAGGALGSAARGSGARASLADPALRSRRDELERDFPELSPYIELTWACLAALPDVLMGKKSAMEVLFADGSMERVEKTYRGNRVADLANQRTAQFVKSYVEARLRIEPAARVRILEVGAGTGGTSAAVLEALEELGARGRVTYEYTDVSAAFTRHGERTFGERFKFAEFKTLDLEQSPLDQGFEAGGVDLVIGSHVLHATRRIDRSLRHVKSLLRRNGLLILNETTQVQAFLTVTFGLMDGWWLFEDEGLRMKGSPLLDAEHWRAALEAGGFHPVREFSLHGGGARGGSPAAILVAESDGRLPAGLGERTVRRAETYESFVRLESQTLQSPEGERHWSYWQQRLAGRVPALDLPLDRPRPMVQTYRGQWVPFRIDGELAARLRDCARERGVTLYALLLAGYQALLHRYSGQDDFAVGCPTAGRHLRAFDRVVGHFVNTLPVRADLSGDPSAAALIERTRDALLGALEHQAFPFPVMVERLNPKRDAGRPPLFQTMFVFQEPPGDLALAEVVTDFYSSSARATIRGLEFESFPISQQEGQFDLSIEMTGTASSLKGVLKYNESLFDRPSMERMSRHFAALLESMVEAPERRVSELPLMDERELRQVVDGWNRTARDWRLECVHALVEEQARTTPEAMAVIFEGQRMTYSELNGRANRLARFLVKRGLAPEEPVGICMERSPEMIVAVLAILKAGGAYVPLDPSYPRERLAFMMDDAAIRRVVTSDSLPGVLPIAPQEAIALGRDWPAIAEESEANLEPTVGPEGLAYLLYTSGSTGRPKGVAMPHGPLCNLLRWQREQSESGAGAKTLQFTSLSFDVSFQEIFATLGTGGALVLVPEGLRQDPDGVLRLIATESVERIFVPFVVLKLLAEAAEGEALIPSSLREIITAGEQLRITPSIAEFLKKLGSCRLFNQYGPTEAHVVTSHTLEGPPERWPYLPPIGRPIANARIFIVDRAMRPVPPGVPGELLIGGACLARGYHRQPALTEAKFIASPFGSEGEKVYRTGDLARFRVDGAIEYLGRADDQVKIHGVRIELAEVEKHILAHPAVAEAVVICDEDPSAVKRLCAYFVRKAAVSPSELKAHLVERLPAAMIPAVFVELSAIPLLPNKKVDRRALPAPHAAAPAPARCASPRNDVEARLMEIARTALHLEHLGVEDDLFELGVNSLTTLSVQRKIDQAFPGKIRVPDLLRFPTVAALAAVIKSRGAAAPKQSVKSEQYQKLLEVLGSGH